MSNLTSDDLIFYKDDEEKIYSGGFSVNSIMLKRGFSPIMSIQTNKNEDLTNIDTDHKVSNLFSDLVVPNWAIYYPEGNTKIFIDHNIDSFDNHNNFKKEKYHNELNDESDDECIDDDLYEKLLKIALVDENEIKKMKRKNKKTKRNNKTKRNKTKKNN